MFVLIRSTLLAAFLATASAVPALSMEPGAQVLGLWHDRVGEGVAYGEPPAAGVLLVVDPVAAVPVSRRPAPRAAVPVAAAHPAALKPAEHQSLNEGVKPPPVSDLMAPRYNPDVPMPHPDLEGYSAPASRLNRPQPYVRGTDHGAVLGLRVPLNRASVPSSPTRSSGSLPGLDGGFSR
jgi:hypothetical protein